MKIILDSNVLISSIGRKSPLGQIWDSFIEGYYQIVVSEDILKEYEENPTGTFCSRGGRNRDGNLYRIT